MFSQELKKKKKKKDNRNIRINLLLINRGFSVLLFNRLTFLKRTGLILNRLDLIIMRSSLSVTLRVKSGVVHK